MNRIDLPNDIAHTQTHPVTMVSKPQTTEPERPLCECGQRPRQKHCVLCIVCETLLLLIKDHRDPNTL